MHALNTVEKYADALITRLFRATEGEIIIFIQNISWGVWVLLHGTKDYASYQMMQYVMPLPVWGGLSIAIGLGIAAARMYLNIDPRNKVVNALQTAFLWLSSWWWLSVALTFAKLNIYSTAVVTYPTFAFAAIVVLFKRRRRNG